MVKIIDDFCKKNNLIFGICNSEILEIKENIDLTNIPFFDKTLNHRIDPKLFFKESKSIIVLGMGNNENIEFPELSGILPDSMTAIDYHILLKEKCDNLISEMSEKKEFNYKIHIDTGPLAERHFAVKAGLGFIGKNSNLITEGFGSFLNLALILTDLDLPKSDPKAISGKKCGDCNLCKNYCPGKALGEKGFIYEKCISYLSQKKGILSIEEMAAMGVTIYGCDICRNICPYNNKENLCITDEYKCNALINLLNMSKKEFNKRYSKSAFFWRGHTTILRNGLISAYNIKCNAIEKLLDKFYLSESPVLAETVRILKKNSAL